MAETLLPTSSGQRVARYLLIAALVLLGGWMLRRFMSALAWSVILGVATWPWYRQWAAKFHGKHSALWAAMTFTTIVALVLIAPLSYALVITARETIMFIREHSVSGPANLHLPDWVAHLPWLGDWLQQQWRTHVDADESLSQLIEPYKPHALEVTRFLGAQVIRRIVTLGFTILIVFFVYLYGESLAQQVRRIWDRVFGASAQPLLLHAVSAVRAAVDGIVLVAVAEGALMYATYAIAGVGHPVLLGALTGVFAMIPFAAPIVFGVVALVAAGQGSMGAAVGILAVGATMLFVVDHFIRPAIIGSTARLPFLWTLLGILGGVETFGLVGLFIGPALMAALCSLWRDWSDTRVGEAIDDAPAV